MLIKCHTSSLLLPSSLSPPLSPSPPLPSPSSSTLQVNTFQCVMASDSNSLYVLFLYADIQWTRADEGSALAQAGFNAGDNRTFYLIPGSGTEAIRNINSTSNVGVPGMWIFKVSESFVQTAECKERTSKP